MERADRTDTALNEHCAGDSAGWIETAATLPYPFLTAAVIAVTGELTLQKNRMPVRIAWGDCDPAGIVFFPRYFAFCNEATGALFESIGLPKPLLLKTYDIVGYPVVEVSANFSHPSTFGEDVVIESSVVEWGRSSFRLLHRILKDEVPTVECYEKRVWAARDPDNPGGIRAKPIPDDIKAKLGGLPDIGK